MVELGPHDAKTKNILKQWVRRVVALITGTIAKGQAQGEFRRDIEAPCLAMMLTVVANGLQASLKGPISKKDAQGVVEIALKVLG